MSSSHTPRFSLVISLSMLTGLGLLVFTHLHPFTWRIDLHPMWGWALCGMGLSVIMLSLLGFLWSPLEDHWPVLVFLCALGLLITVVGWDLEWALLLLSYFVRGLMYLAGPVLAGFGVWQVITKHSDSAKWSFAAKYNQGYGAGHRKGYEEGYAKAYLNEHDSRYKAGHTAGRAEWYAKGHAEGRTEGYDEGYSAGHAKGYTYGHAAGGRQKYREGYDEGHAKGYAEGRSTTRERKTRDPWQVLEIPPSSTQEEIRQAYRKQSQLYHPDKVSRLGKDLRDMAEEKTKDINHAYERLGGR